MSERDIETHAACGIAGLALGAICMALFMMGQHSKHDLKTEVKVAHAEASATSAAAVISNRIEGDLIRHDLKTDNAVDRGLRGLRVVPVALPAKCEGGYVIAPVAGDPDSLWRAFADGYNGVLASPDGSGAGVHSGEGEGQLQAGADRPQPPLR